jgi:hypothetical protein
MDYSDYDGEEDFEDYLDKKESEHIQEQQTLMSIQDKEFCLDMMARCLNFKE